MPATYYICPKSCWHNWHKATCIIDLEILRYHELSQPVTRTVKLNFSQKCKSLTQALQDLDDALPLDL